MNYKMVVQYEGKKYSGWQRQKNALSIQEVIEEKIKLITSESVNLIGSGRTDAGVHAFRQVCNFRIEKELDTVKIFRSLNAVLPVDISVTSIDAVHESFHSRFDAVSRSYLYYFTFEKSPFYRKYSYQYGPAKNLDVEKLNDLSRVFLGKHNFKSFCKKGDDLDKHDCNILNIHWRKDTTKLIFFIEANRFLHGMVRAIGGTILYAVENGLNEDYILAIFAERDRKASATALPSQGLFLFKVKYRS